jgi:hypothetical protein
MKTFAAIALLLCPVAFQAQTSPEVVVAGNSIALFEGTLQHDIFPTLDPSLVSIFGHEGFNCSQVETNIQFDVFGPGGNTWTPAVAVLIDTTNDWYHTPRTTAPQLVKCLKDTIDILLGHEPGLQIVLLNTPPYVPFPAGCEQTDLRWLIEQYNLAIPALQAEYPNKVTVVDAFTPFELGTTGYADPSKMVGPCGIHPGQPSTWDVGQQILAGTYSCTVLHLLGMTCP